MARGGDRRRTPALPRPPPPAPPRQPGSSLGAQLCLRGLEQCLRPGSRAGGCAGGCAGEEGRQSQTCKGRAVRLCCVCAHSRPMSTHARPSHTCLFTCSPILHTAHMLSHTQITHSHVLSHNTHTQQSHTHIYGGSHAHTRSGPTSDGDGGRIRKTLTRGRNTRRHRDRDKEVADRLTPSERNTAMGSKEVAAVTTESAQGRWHPSPALCRSHWNRSGPSCSGPPL